MEENNITSTMDHLKDKFGCLPPEKWTVMTSSSSFVNIICISKDYKTYDEPKEIAPNPILMSIENSTIVNIDEKKKTMTMELLMSYVWVDERIKVVFSNNAGIIFLPSSTTEEKTNIWTPFQHLEIWGLRERKYISDPTILKIALMSDKSASAFKQLNTNNSAPYLTSAVWSQISWIVAVPCSYDFSDFPFDVQKCRLAMSLPFNWNLTVLNDPTHIFKYVKGGFEINSRFYDESGELAWHNLAFGVEVTLKRQLSRYVYQYYLPSIIIVLASSVSFIIPLSAIPGRVALMGTQFLTLTNIFLNQMVNIYVYLIIGLNCYIKNLPGTCFAPEYCILHFQTLSPSEDMLSLLGFYLLASLVFVFFQMLEFAFVLVLKELYDPKLVKTNNDKDESESRKVISKQAIEMQITTGKVLPFKEMNRDLDMKGVTELRENTVRVKKSNFFEKLPLTRKIDSLAFIIYHFAYFLFNMIYWNKFKR